jgi:hypothetical protein
MSELRARARILYNALNFDTPVNFGQEELFPNGLGEDKYVDSLHGPAARDPVQELANQIDLSDSAGAYLFTGNRGTGKTTELLRLATILREYDCEVFYADMADYLTLTQRVEVSDFLISVLGAFSEKIGIRFTDDPGKPSFFERIRSFLNSNVQFTEVKIPAGWIEFKAALQQNPTFKEQLQERTRGVIEQLVKQARDFVIEAVQYVRGQRANPDLKIVLIIDSVERLRGVGNTEDIREIFKSAETLFSSHADKLRFTALTVVYTVPPYLSALAGALGSVYAGGRIYALPSVHIYERYPEPGDEPAPHDEASRGWARSSENAFRNGANSSPRRSSNVWRSIRAAPGRGPTAAVRPVARPGHIDHRCRGRGARRYAANCRQRPGLAAQDHGEP